MNAKQLLLFGVLASLFRPSPRAADAPTIPEEFKTEIRKRVDNLYSTAMVVGVLDANGASYFSYGSADPDRGGALNEDTIFEIAGASKTFTGTLLAEMVGRGELSLTNLIQEYLPPGCTAPVYGSKQTGISFADLATHRSGLPDMPNNLGSALPTNPEAGYTAQQMYDFLNFFQLTRTPGGQYEFSNYGVGLLGQILADSKGMDFEALLRQRVLDVLGLKDTTVTLSSAQENRVAAPFSGVIRYPADDEGVLAPSLGLHSTVRDLLAFLAANAGLVQSPLYAAMTNACSPRSSTDTAVKVGLCWEVRTAGTITGVDYAGQVGAFNSYVGFIPSQQRAVAMLATGFQCSEDLGRSLLSPKFPKFTSYPVPVQVPTRALRQYAGTYTGSWGGGRHSFDIGLERGHLTFLWSGDQLPVTLYATASAQTNTFRLAPASASTVLFHFDAAGQVKNLYWNGSWGSAGPFPKVSSLSLPPEVALTRSQSSVTLELIGDPGSSYTIESSSDLRTWSKLMPNMASGTAIPISKAEPERYYRARE